LKFLGFEQTFKNSLTTLPMGGAKGGSDFNPRGKSDGEILRFCRSFMTELEKYIGPNTDVPAGDMGVGLKEIGYMYGQYKRIRNENTGVLTGKGLSFGGSLIRPEATGYGSMYFANQMLITNNDTFAGKTISISGFGNVAWGAVMKATELGAKVVTISGPDGYIHDEEGVGTPEKWAYMSYLRASNNDVVEPYAKKFGAKFVPGKKPWLPIWVDGLVTVTSNFGGCSFRFCPDCLENAVMFVFGYPGLEKLVYFRAAIIETIDGLAYLFDFGEVDCGAKSTLALRGS
jgi:glutamate dehydrogenase (NADP+)